MVQIIRCNLHKLQNMLRITNVSNREIITQDSIEIGMIINLMNKKNQQSLQGPTRDEPRENVNLSRPMYDDQEQPKRNHLNTPVEIQQEYQSGPSKSNRHLRDQENSNQFTNIDNRKSINEKQNDGRFRESRGGGSRNNNYNNHQYLHRNPNNRPSNRGSNNVRNASP